MEVMEMDSAFIARQVKNLRKMFKLTQENLADAAGLTSRTIEKIETGRHRPQEQTLRSLARALNLDISYFEKPSPEQEAMFHASIARSVRKTALVPTQPIRTASEFLNAFEHCRAFRFDTPSNQSDELLKLAASMVDWITDVLDGWGDCSMSQRLGCANDFVELCKQLEVLGYLCHMGRHRQALYDKGRSDLVISVGLMSIRPKAEANGKRYAVVELEGRWETVKEERFALPEGFGV